MKFEQLTTIVLLFVLLAFTTINQGDVTRDHITKVCSNDTANNTTE